MALGVHFDDDVIDDEYYDKNEDFCIGGFHDDDIKQDDDKPIGRPIHDDD